MDLLKQLFQAGFVVSVIFIDVDFDLFVQAWCGGLCVT